MRPSGLARWLVALVMAFAVLLAPRSGLSAEAAGTTCHYDATTRNVLLTIEGGTPTLRRGKHGSIELHGRPCGPATVRNTDTISARDESVTAEGTGGAVLTLDLRGGPFAPGYTDEPGTSDEIEFQLQIQGVNPAKGYSALVIIGTSGREHFVVGRDGINLNVGETQEVDADIATRNLNPNDLILEGGLGADVINGLGGHGTGPSNRCAIGLVIRGGGGRDVLAGTRGTARCGRETLAGGSGPDTLRTFNTSGGVLRGGRGNDSLWGDSGPDVLSGGPGDDLLRGESGSDTARYLSAAVGVVVDLRDSMPQDTSGAGVDRLLSVESVFGSSFADVLTGTNGANTMRGLMGDDRLYGLAGPDELRGGDGNDLCDGGGGRDVRRQCER
jgi:Ca2+-binding RTX toxin-like protein